MKSLMFDVIEEQNNQAWFPQPLKIKSVQKVYILELMKIKYYAYLKYKIP